MAPRDPATTAAAGFWIRSKTPRESMRGVRASGWARSRISSANRKQSAIGSTIHPSGRVLHLERDALRQRQFAAPVDGVGLAAHVGLPGIRTRLASAARVLLAAEGSANFGARGTYVHIG